MATQKEVQDALMGMKHGKRKSINMGRMKNGVGRSHAQFVYQVGGGMKPADVIVSPVGQSAAEGRSLLMEDKAVKRKAEKVYNPTAAKKPRTGRAGHSKKNSRSSNNKKKKKTLKRSTRRKSAAKQKKKKNKGGRSKKVKFQRTNSIFARPT